MRIAADDPDWTQRSLCDLLGHEIGHLLGRYHSADPYDVMSLNRAVVQPDCDEAFPRQRGGAGAADVARIRDEWIESR